MMRFAFFLWFLTLAAGCIVEDRPITPPDDGGVDAGPCGTCPVDKPVCTSALECVQCTADDDDYCTAQGQLCDVGSSMCVGCSGDSDCTDPNAARCDNNVCVPCTEHPQCEGIERVGAEQSACDNGVCVDCTPETEGTTCVGGMACDPATKECTNVRIGSLEVCEECVADSQCGEDDAASDAHRCVPMYYPTDPETRFPNSDTGFCLKVFEPGGCVQPYAITIDDRPSLSDPPLRDYCGINEELATCPAVRALETNQSCPGGIDGACPTSGLCRDVGGLSDRCTYLCGDLVECKAAPVPGSTCGSSGSGGDDYCGGG